MRSIRIKSCLIIGSIILTASVHAKSWRINGDLNASADFQTLQEANDNAQSGDTLYLEAYSDYYSADITKQLTILGPGFFISLEAIIVSIRFKQGSEGSYISGVVFRGRYGGSPDQRIEANNITVKYSLITNGSFTIAQGVTGFVFIGNHFVGPNRPNLSGDLTEAVISNNIMFNVPPNSKSCTFTNNIFRLTTGNTQSNFLGNSQVFNNIFIILESAEFNYVISFSEEVTFISNLIQTGIDLPENTDGSNIIASDSEGIFVYNPRVLDTEVPGNVSRDGRWRLTENSPGLGIGVESIDAGVFAGESPYIQSGKGGIPFIEGLLVPSTINKDKGLRVKGRVIFNQ